MLSSCVSPPCSGFVQHGFFCRTLLFSWIRLVVCLFADGFLDFGLWLPALKVNFCVCVWCFGPFLSNPDTELFKLPSLTSAHDCEWTNWSFPMGALRLSPRLRWINISVTRHAAQSERWISGGCGEANPETYRDLGAKNEFLLHSLQPTCTEAT